MSLIMFLALKRMRLFAVSDREGRGCGVGGGEGWGYCCFNVTLKITYEYVFEHQSLEAICSEGDEGHRSVVRWVA